MKRILLAFVAALALLVPSFAQVSVDATKTGTAQPYAGAFAWASVPTCNTGLNGARARITDVGVAPGITVVCDSTRWVPDGPQVLYRSAVPIGVAPSGTMANNGAVTLGTALDITYSDGVYLYYPANAISAGSSAGFYWTVMSSTTVGTVYNNTYTTGNVTPPTSNTAFVTTGPGAFAGSTSALDAFSATIPGNLMGIYGSLRITFAEQHNNSAGTKTVLVKYGGTTFFGSGVTTSTGQWFEPLISNRGATNRQTQAITTAFAGGFTQILGTVDSTANQTAAVNLQHGTATDWTILENCIMEILP